MKGISIPVRANPDGRIALEEGSDFRRQLLYMALSDLGSDNPFVEGLGFEDVAFQLNAGAVRALINSRIRSIMGRFERDGVAKLISAVFQPAAEGEVDLVLTYLDLEDNERRELRRRIGTQ